VCGVGGGGAGFVEFSVCVVGIVWWWWW
jgi:hypothetical protein